MTRVLDDRLISAASGTPRYTLSVPYFMARGSLPFDPLVITTPLQSELHASVRHLEHNGYRRLSVGPFATQAEAEAAFGIVWGHLARLAVTHHVPLKFDHAVQPLQLTPRLITSDDQPIHAMACLALPQVIPEHLYVLHDDVIMATRQPQLISGKIGNTFALPVGRKPSGERVELAFDAYVAAFATQTLPLRFLGLMTTLEILMDEESRSAEEQAMLSQIAKIVESAPGLDATAQSRETRDNAVQAICQRKTLPKWAALKRLIEKHQGRIDMVFGNTRRVGDPEKLARSLYRLRSTITHEGRMAADDATLSTEQALLGVAEGVMLDSLDGRATGNITD